MAYEGKGVWCIAESRGGKVSPVLFELLTAGRKLAAARGETVTAVVIGHGLQDAAGEIAGRGADQVLVVEDASLKEFVDDVYAAVLAKLAEARKPRTLLLPATVYGRSLAPRLSVLLRAGLAADAVGLELDAEQRLLVTRSAYAGNVVATVLLRSVDGPEIATVRPLAFERSAAGGAGTVAAAAPDAGALAGKTAFVSFGADRADEIDLGAAEKIVSGGRGLGKPEGFELVRKLAKTLGAAVGASRAAVDSGWIPYKHQVGLTGRSVRPKLYVACGISGQIQHMAGMNASGTIVAINSDAECPMMKVATYAVQGDLYKLLPAIVAEIEKARG
ncbi:MAG: hypothetical protein A2X36_15255 [Elusimicrobia bacterium GWA2_69_24]|nr:MAG: hypothetical protein A2X36_15255 [Elusimicrobia bacterium GWA2_69_24]HBL16826.1 electron transfer flavoprotein subunit alpha [Elusimicrobiota bacterium]